MNTPQSISPRRPLRALCATGLSLIALAAGLAGSAGAHVSPDAAQDAAQRGANWFRTTQKASGRLSSDWAMTALAATGLNAADVRTSLVDPSAQDYYLGQWQASGPGGAGTDAARGILAGVAGGIQTSRLSTSPEARKSNLVARLAEMFDGEQIGSPGLLNDDIFGVLALYHAGAPRELLRRVAAYLRTKQLEGGGWSWNASPEAPDDAEMTGATVAALCAAGIAPSDPDLIQAFDFLRSAQEPASGGFEAPFGIGTNTDTTAWVASGLIQCGVDPQGAEWTTDQGKTPFDYLLSLQQPDGHFDWKEGSDGGAFETFNSVRPLAGAGFSAPAPPRLDGASRAIRPVPPVEAGTTVPITLVIDHGPGAKDVRMCRIDIESGSSLDEVLAAAQAGSTPAECVTEFAASSAPGGVRVASLNGVSQTDDYEWTARVDGSPAQTATGEPIGLGDLVFLKLDAVVAEPPAPPAVAVPPVGAPVQQPHVPRPRVAVRGKALWRLGGRVAVRLRCPRGNGATGCRGALVLRFRSHPQGRLVRGGAVRFALASGTTRVVAARATGALRRALAKRRRVKVRVVVATRAVDGGSRMTRARRFVAKRQARPAAKRGHRGWPTAR